MRVVFSLLLVGCLALAFAGSAVASDYMIPVLLREKTGVPSLPSQGTSPAHAQSPGDTVVLGGSASNASTFGIALIGAALATVGTLAVLTRANARSRATK